MEHYNFKEIEKKWQKHWEKNNSFYFKPNKDKIRNFYMLEMFPYPSGQLHLGHVRNFGIGDVVARFKMMQGYNVLHPMGADAFGLPAENAAIKNKINPSKWTEKNIEEFKKSMKMLGFSYDFSRFVATCFPEYYGKQQEIFIDMYKKGLIYRKESYVNWDPVDQTVLANEQVVNGRGWRSGAIVERKKLNQWFFKITNYAEELLRDIDDKLIGWPEKVRLMQKNWIGKSSGAMFKMKVVFPSFPRPLGDASSSPHHLGEASNFPRPLGEMVSTDDFHQVERDSISELLIYTTRPDTLFGASFVGISSNHPLAECLSKNDKNIAEFCDECEKTSVDEATTATMEKKGFDTGLKAINPFTNEELPIYIANFILMDYGTGAIFGCPAHDERDYDFAKKYGLQIKQVVTPLSTTPLHQGARASVGDFHQGARELPDNLPQVTRDELITLPFTDEGYAINSGFLDGLSTKEAKKAAIEKLKEMGIGDERVNYHLRDWGFSRQRYWGCPIPMVYCEHCGTVPLNKEDLPLRLPEDVTFDGKGNPLEKHPTWKYTKCPHCGKPAIRETDTMDTFVDSSWYFLRYPDLCEDKPLNKEICNNILPIDQYVGGIEHATGHLMYARFFTKALRDCGYINIDEPVKKLFNQGMVCHKAYRGKTTKDWCYPWNVEEKGGKFYNIETKEELSYEGVIKMSKSKCNVVDNAKIVDAYGADSARMFVLSDSPADKDFEWTEQGIEGCWKYINKFYRMVSGFSEIYELSKINYNNTIIKETHKTIKFVTEYLENLEFNKAIAKVREFTNFLEKLKLNSQEEKESYYFALVNVTKLFLPFAPHLCSELLERLRITDFTWPIFDDNFTVENTITIAIQINGKLRGTLQIQKDLPKNEVENLVKNEENIKKYLEGNEIKKTIVVPNKLVNFVI